MQASVDFCNDKNLTCTPKNKEEKLTKMWDQTVPIPAMAPKFVRGKTTHKKCCFEIKQ